jgi:riboflavin biosynthesis pyrimidine reductase
VGGKTLLDEDPKLTVKSEALRAERVARGLAPNPVKVGIVTQAELKPHSKFLHEGNAKVVIFTTHQTSKDKLAFLRSQGADVYADHHERLILKRARNFAGTWHPTPHGRRRHNAQLWCCASAGG